MNLELGFTGTFPMTMVAAGRPIAAALAGVMGNPVHLF